MDINRVNVTARLTREPELRMTSNGTNVLNLGIAVNDRVKSPDGKWTDYANYIDCKLFGNRAEGVYPYLSKGQKVAIEGKLRYSQWEKDGQKRSKVEVVIDNIEFLERKEKPEPEPEYAEFDIPF